MSKHWHARGCCKLTLEVLQGNAAARRLYARYGFDGYAFDPAFGHAVFLQNHEPNAVRDFVVAHRARLAPLTVREALKHCA